MDRKEIIYDNLLRLLKALAPEGDTFEQYFESLDTEEKRSTLLSLSEDIETEYNSIRRSKIEDKLHSDFEQIVSLLQNFLNEYENYPNHRINEILILIELFAKLNSSIDQDLDLSQIIDVSTFTLVQLSKEIAHQNFIYYDEQELKNSVFLFDSESISDLHNFLDQENLAIDLNLCLMAMIGRENIILNSGHNVLINSSLEDKPAQTWSCVALHLLKEGYEVHEPYIYNLNPEVHSSRKINSEEKYQQFNDTITILSEYNYQKDILDKYLRLYHVLENFMYKYPLVKLERKHDGAIFSIRDFQRMYDKISINEFSSLNTLIQKISETNYDGNDIFEVYIFNKIQNLNPNEISDVNKLNTLFKYLRLTKKRDREEIDIEFADITNNNSTKIFATLVYAFRNSIVHNKETEFHLTHETLNVHPVIDNTAKIVIEKLLIPVLEEIVYALIIDKNDLVWFENSKLNLWVE